MNLPESWQQANRVVAADRAQVAFPEHVGGRNRRCFGCGGAPWREIGPEHDLRRFDELKERRDGALVRGTGEVV